MDYDDFNPDDEIGRCELRIKDVGDETKDHWLDVDMEAGDDTAHDKKVSNKVLPARVCVCLCVWGRGVQQSGCRVRREVGWE